MWIEILATCFGILLFSLLVYVLFFQQSYPPATSPSSTSPPSSPPFVPSIQGTLDQVTADDAASFFANMSPDEIRAMVVLNTDLLKSKQNVMIFSVELYSLFDQRVFPKVFKQLQDKNLHDRRRATKNDLGGIFVAHYSANNNYELYSFIALQENMPIMLGRQSFDKITDLANDIKLSFKMFQKNLNTSAYSVAVMKGPNLIDLDTGLAEFGIDPTKSDFWPLNSGESFGMYTTALDTWFQDHQPISVERYTRRQRKNLQDPLTS